MKKLNMRNLVIIVASSGYTMLEEYINSLTGSSR